MPYINDLNTRKDLAYFLGLPPKKLTHLLYIKGIDNCYTTFDIPKKSGGIRTIHAPNNELKPILRILASELSKFQQQIWKDHNISQNISHGFTQKKSIITNAKIHIRKKYVLNVDLKDFFDCFHFGRVAGYFEKNSYFSLPHDIAIILAQLTCYKGNLPQGAPTSPIISNLICQILDYKVLSLAKKYKLDYTRYADDLTFSTNDKSFVSKKDDFLSELTIITEKGGFEINTNKTRLIFKDSRQSVTGLVVNQKANVERSFYKSTKAMALSLYKNGNFTINEQIGNIEQLNGRFAFINQLEKYNNSIDKKSKHNIYYLSSKEKEYRKFLFYKLFIANDMPLIITEGKTDIVYLKSALKNLYKDYPELIKKTKSGNYKFKIKFLSRTKTFCYLFGVSKDGADTMKNIYNYFSKNKGDKKIYPDYKTFFQKKYSLNISQPILFLFDHELASKSKPLYKFINYLGVISSNKQKEIENSLFTSIDDENMFLVTNPLIGNQNECEIEELFLEETLGHVISGKNFSLKKDYDTNAFYGKEIFSKYIASNYKTIDFSNFKVLLDVISQIAKSKTSSNSKRLNC